MADAAEDKERAEKLAAGRKRLEQFQKDKAKKGAKKEKSGKGKVAPTSTDKATTTATGRAAEGKAEEDAVAPADEGGNEDADGKGGKAEDGTVKNGAEDEAQETTGTTLEADPEAAEDANTGIPAVEDVDESSEKQSARIVELEGENERLRKELDGKRDHAEDQGRIDAAKDSEEVSRLKAELENLQRQNRRRSSTAASTTPNLESLQAQLASKTTALESLELELSTLRHTLQTTSTHASDLESRVTAAEAASNAAENRFNDLKASIDTSTSTSDKSSEDTTKRLALLTADLSTARHTATAAQTHATTLQKKCETLTTLHRDAEARHQAQTRSRLAELDAARKESAAMRRRLAAASNENARLRSSSDDTTSPPNNSRPMTGRRKDVDGDGGGVEDLEEEELATLRARVRSLEAEAFDLRRGVWRDRRREMQGGPGPADTGEAGLMTPGGGGGFFDDVDLDTPTSAKATSGGVGGAFALQNIIGAFTGSGNTNNNERSTSFGSGAYGQASGTGRGSMDLLDEDGDGFDEGAFAAAQAEEAKARLERVKDVKRGLGGWRGWRVDLVDVRGGAMAGVFDV